MLTIAQQYVAEYRTVIEAAEAFTADLMRGDPRSFKAGYSRENALLATTDAFDLSGDQQAELRARMA